MSILIKKTDIATAFSYEELVAKVHGVYPSEIHSLARDNKVAHARFIVWYLLRRKEKWSLSKIAVHYNRDHTTVSSGLIAAITLGLAVEAETMYASANTPTYPPNPQG